MLRKKLIVGNWKMNFGPQEAAGLVRELVQALPVFARCEIWIAPPAISLPAVREAASGSPLRLGAQNVHWERSGAFTGEISVPMLQQLGSSFSLVGHSERRHILGEDDALTARRAAGAQSAAFTVIFCVGETLAERDSGQTQAVLERQLGSLHAALSPEQAAGIILAYEPVWAIGTGKTASPQQISEAHRFIAECWTSFYPAAQARILYGGSVTPDNFREIASLPEVAGALVGGASLSVEKFTALARIAEAQ